MNTMLRSTLTSLLLAAAAGAQANNGMYLSGYGFESAMMGGADVAVARDAFAANNNPAGMTQLDGAALDLLGVVYYVPWGGHSDSFGNDDKPFTQNMKGGYGSGAYAQHIADSPFSAGASLTVQGGVGWVFSGVNTPFGTRDDMGSLFTVVRLAPAMAWKVNDDLSLGASIGVNYVSANQQLFPNTTVGPVVGGFHGFRFKDAGGTALTAKLGLQYHPTEDVTIGLTYGTKASVPIKGGTLRINYGNGIGVVRYDDVKLTGFHLPEELALGISFRPTPPLLVSLQGKWYHWSDAIGTLAIVARNPRTPGAPSTVTIPGAVDFKDQNLLQMGLAYDYDADTVLLGGVNYGRRPIPDKNMSPLLQPIAELHYMIGAAHRIGKEWQVGEGLEIIMPRTVTYDSPLFGPAASEKVSNLLFHVALSRRW